MHKYNTNITNISKYDLSVWWLFSICPFPRVTTNKRCHSCTTFSVAATPPPRFILTIENLLRVPFSKVRIVLGPNTDISNHWLTNLSAPTGAPFPTIPENLMLPELAFLKLFDFQLYICGLSFQGGLYNFVSY